MFSQGQQYIEITQDEVNEAATVMARVHHQILKTFTLFRMASLAQRKHIENGISYEQATLQAVNEVLSGTRVGGKVRAAYRKTLGKIFSTRAKLARAKKHAETTPAYEIVINKHGQQEWDF